MITLDWKTRKADDGNDTVRQGGSAHAQSFNLPLVVAKMVITRGPLGIRRVSYKVNLFKLRLAKVHQTWQKGRGDM